MLDFFAGVTRWECVGGPRTGLGARYRMLMRVGSAEVGGLIETVEFDPERDLAWTSVTGIDQRGRWRLREGRDGTRVELRLQFGVAGGGIWSGWPSSWPARSCGGTSSGRSRSSSGRSSTSRCAPRRRPAARRG